jgi:hypothetical protein
MAPHLPYAFLIGITFCILLIELMLEFRTMTIV